MTLDELKKIESDAKAARHNADRYKRAQTSLQELRTGPHSTFELAIKVVERWSFGSDEIARDEFFDVLTEQMSYAMRIAELRLEAKTREASGRERLLNSQLTSFLGETKPEGQS